MGKTDKSVTAAEAKKLTKAEENTATALEARIVALEGNVVRIDEAIVGIPDAVLQRFAEGFATDVAPQLQAMLLAESGAIVGAGCKQLATAAAKKTYSGAKAVVVAPVKACKWTYEKVLGVCGYELADEAPVGAKKATVAG